ncbi:hypothetical protein [Rhizobium sp. GCM10022189]|uniref:hypothetical protein n=1 Tax=Rhizobium sp. GCM10022189 TaxID=3252654 RepID=UPI003605E32A
MSEPIRLFIVTDDAAQACLAVMHCHLSDCPSFVRVLTSAADIRAVPDGARCIGQWFAWSDRSPTDAQMAWEWRRDIGGIEGVSLAFFDRVDEWNAKRRAAEEKILAEALGEAADGPVIPYSEFANAQAAARAVESETVAVLPKQSRWH